MSDELSDRGRRMRVLLVAAGFCVVGGSVVYRQSDVAHGSIIAAGNDSTMSPPQRLSATETDDTDLEAKLARVNELSHIARHCVRALDASSEVAGRSIAGLRINPFRTAATIDSAETARWRQEEERRAVLQAVRMLEVQSIVCTETRKSCLINNTLYHEGQSVPGGFTVEKVAADCVVVKNGVYRFQLK